MRKFTSFKVRQVKNELHQQGTIHHKSVVGLNNRQPKMLLLLFLLLFICNTGVIYVDDALTANELVGRKIYREGSDGSKHNITAFLSSDDDGISATNFSCANCHGLEGNGKQEGALTVPAITSQHLFASTYSNTLNKQAYNENTLAKAITKGISAQNNHLSAAMPRYNLTASQTQALIAYLKRLGSTTDIDAGVDTTEVHLGTLLPLTGPLENTGKTLKATLDACITELNSQGLIYGRKITLTTLDSGTSKAEILASTKQLISETKPFALISGYFPEMTTELYETLAQEKIPVIAPLTFLPDSSPTPASNFFYFLPSYSDQYRALVDYWLEHRANDKVPTKPKIAIVHSNRTTDLNMVAAIRKQFQLHHLDTGTEIAVPQTIQNPDKNHFINLEIAKADAIFFIANAKELAVFNKVLTKADHQPTLLGLIAMLGTDIMNIPDLVITNMLLATPFALNDSALQPFAAMLIQHSVSLQSPGLQRIACETVTFVAEGLKQTGKHLTRNKFIQSLEEIRSFNVEVMPPLQFEPNSRKGTSGAYILTVDTKAKSLSPLSAWVRPADSK